MAEKYTLLPEHKAQLEGWKNKWIANTMSTKAMDDHDKEEMVKAVVGMYKAAKLPPPKNIVFVPSPFVLRFAGGFAAAIWWNRNNAQAKDNIETPPLYVVTCDAIDTATYHATYNGVPPSNVSTIKKTVITPGTYSQKWFICPLKEINEWVKQAAKEDYEFWLKCVQQAYDMWQGGNQWSAFDSFLTFFKYVVKLDLPEYENYQYWEKAAIHGGPRIVHPDFCMISDRPEFLKTDGQNRPHCTDGPFCGWRDGTCLYAIHGTYVPQWLVEQPAEKIDPQEVIREKNAQVRREIVRKIGIDRVCYSLHAKVIDSYEEYELLDLQIDENTKWRYLKMHNPSVPEVWHIEGVSNECNTVFEALHWRKPDFLRNLPIDDENGENWFQQGDVVMMPEGAKSVKRFPKIIT